MIVPVRVFADGNRADRKAQLAQVVADIGQTRAASRHRDGRQAPRTPTSPCKLVRDRDLTRTIAKDYGSERAQRDQDLARSAMPVRLPQERAPTRSTHSDVILTVDNGDFVFFDCAYEELLQSLGPINDTSSVPWTMFNDKVSMGFFDVYDQYILNLLYDPRIRPGMTVEEVKAVLPAVLADVRAWVKQGEWFER